MLRVLDRSIVNLAWKTSACREHIYEYIVDTIEKPNGIFIVTGPTGAGQDHHPLRRLAPINTIDSKLLTAEDPVEYDIDGIMQVPINEAIGLTFAARPAGFPAPGPGPHHGRRDARPGDRQIAHPGLAHRPPGALHPAHQRRRRAPSPA